MWTSFETGELRGMARDGIEPPTFHPHALRHSCGVILASKGYSAFDIQRRLGHASLSSTLCYVDLKGKEELERNKAMSEALRI
jgi:integrase